MELKIVVSYKELLGLIEQLSEEERYQLSTDLQKRRIKKKERSNFLRFILNGPVMNDKQYQDFIHHRTWSLKNESDS